MNKIVSSLSLLFSLSLCRSFALLPQLSSVLRHDERESEKNYIDGCRYDEQNDKRKYMARTFI